MPNTCAKSLFALPSRPWQAAGLPVVAARMGRGWDGRLPLLLCTLLPVLDVVMTSAFRLFVWRELSHYDGSVERHRLLGAYADETGQAIMPYRAVHGSVALQASARTQQTVPLPRT